MQSQAARCAALQRRTTRLNLSWRAHRRCSPCVDFIESFFGLAALCTAATGSGSSAAAASGSGRALGRSASLRSSPKLQCIHRPLHESQHHLLEGEGSRCRVMGGVVNGGVCSLLGA